MTTATAERRQPRIDERYLRNASIIDQNKLRANPVAVVGVGAIGSALAEMLVKMGVKEINLIDPDEVDTINLSVQGFHESEVGELKVDAVGARLEGIAEDIDCNVYPQKFGEDSRQLKDDSVVFVCVDSLDTRREIFEAVRFDHKALCDGRMTSETFLCFFVDLSEADRAAAYGNSIHPQEEAFGEGCTQKATIYCASIAAGIMCGMFKQWVMEGATEFSILGDLWIPILKPRGMKHYVAKPPT